MTRFAILLALLLSVGCSVVLPSVEVTMPDPEQRFFVKLYAGPEKPLDGVAVIPFFGSRYQVEIPPKMFWDREVSGHIDLVDGQYTALGRNAFLCVLPGEHTVVVDVFAHYGEVGRARYQLSDQAEITMHFLPGFLYQHEWVVAYKGSKRWSWNMQFLSPVMTPDEWHENPTYREFDWEEINADRHRGN